MSLLKAALGYAATAYLSDTFVKPRQLGKLAREHCNQVQKPLLLIHDAGVAHHIFGAPVKADFSRRTAYPVPAPDKTFGAVLAVGVLECLRNPDRALAEWRRVAGRVFVAVPSWYSPHAWLSPEHRWFIDPTLSRALPLWTNRRGVHLLQVSDRRYGERRWNPTTSRLSPRAMTSTTTPTTTQGSPSQGTGTRPVLHPPSPAMSMPRLPSPESSSPSPSQSPYGDMSDLPAMDMVSEGGYPDISEIPSLGNGPLPSVPSDSSKSVLDLMVISSQKFDEN